MQIAFIFDQNDYVFVRDHCPENHPVIPFVSVIDAFYTTLQKKIGSCVLHDIRLIKGIILPDFKTFETTIEIDEDKNTIQLIGENNIVHYKASYGPTESQRPNSPDSTGMTNLLKGDYEFLFHGPLLQSIVSIKTNETHSEAIGTLKTAVGMKSAKTDWVFDPFSCDGALQMGCQLAFMAKQKASLPSKIKKAVFYQKPIDAEVFVHLVFQKMSGLYYVFDAHLFDQKGVPICSLEGVESYFRLFKQVQA